MRENAEKIRERILSLIDSEFDSDAAFEREMNLPKKTVNNWRRCRSTSFMQMLPTISQRFDINISDLMDMPLRADSSNLSDEEMALITLYRKSRTMPKKMRAAMKETIESTIRMYMALASESKVKSRKSDKD